MKIEKIEQTKWEIEINSTEFRENRKWERIWKIYMRKK